VPASEAASWLMPSIRSPSLQIRNAVSQTSGPNRARKCFSAIAMRRVADPGRAGRGDLDPLVWRYPGGGVRERIGGVAEVVELEPEAGQVQHRVSSIEAWPAESTKRSRSGQSGSAASYFITRVHKTSASGASGHRRTRMAGIRSLYRVHASRANDVYGARFELIGHRRPFSRPVPPNGTPGRTRARFLVARKGVSEHGHLAVKP